MKMHITTNENGIQGPRWHMQGEENRDLTRGSEGYRVVARPDGFGWVERMFREVDRIER